MCKAMKIPKLPSECLAVTVVMSTREKTLSVLYLGFVLPVSSPSLLLSTLAVSPFPSSSFQERTINVKLDLESFFLPLTPAVVFGGSGGKHMHITQHLGQNLCITFRVKIIPSTHFFYILHINNKNKEYENLMRHMIFGRTLQRFTQGYKIGPVPQQKDCALY